MNDIDWALIIAVLGVVGTVIQTFHARKQTKLAQEQSEKVDIAKSQNTELKKLFSEQDELLSNVSAVLIKLEEILIEESRLGIVKIQNFGLDLETVVPWFVNKIGTNNKLSNVELIYKGLIINTDSEFIQSMIDGKSDVTQSTVKNRLEEIRKLDNFQVSKVKVEIKSYDLPPVFHGFLVNDKHLFLSFTEIEDEKLRGGSYPYVYMQFNYNSKLNRHYFNMFKTWFGYIWNRSKETYKKEY